MKPNLKIGERIIVNGIDYAIARVKDITWNHDEVRWHIILDWGGHGTSRVCDTDENNVWYRYSITN